MVVSLREITIVIQSFYSNNATKCIIGLFRCPVLNLFMNCPCNLGFADLVQQHFIEFDPIIMQLIGYVRHNLELV